MGGRRRQSRRKRRRGKKRKTNFRQIPLNSVYLRKKKRLTRQFSKLEQVKGIPTWSDVLWSESGSGVHRQFDWLWLNVPLI